MYLLQSIVQLVVLWIVSQQAVHFPLFLHQAPPFKSQNMCIRIGIDYLFIYAVRIDKLGLCEARHACSWMLIWAVQFPPTDRSMSIAIYAQNGVGGWGGPLAA